MAKPIAEELAKKQKEISVSEFFERNKHILGFDSSVRALITSVKEAVDNALDACEEAQVLPDLYVEVRREGPAAKVGQTEEIVMIVEDNGPGIVKQQVGNIFARLLYGSRFHAIRQSRGQQGIGISATVMYGQLTTGKPATVVTKIGPKQPILYTQVKLDTRNNKPDVVKQETLFSDTLPKDYAHFADKEHGTRIEVAMTGKYQRGPQSVFEYLRSTAIVNPHARITFREPDGTTTVFERATDILPAPTKEIKPHPEGVELGTLLKMAKNTSAKTLTTFLQEEFSRVSSEKAKEICDAAALSTNLSMEKFDLDEAKALLAAFSKVKLLAPPTDCLSPIGEVLVRKGLKKELPDTEFIATVTRPPAVYSGRPFVVEAGLAYGGSLPKDESVRIIRFANRVPLLYQKGACVSTLSVESMDWRRYELDQRGGKGLPVGPVVLLVHVASVNVPFTSEAKEAIADIDQIKNEIVLALRECARKMGSHVRKKAKLARMKEKEEIIRKLIPRIAEKAANITGKPVPDYEPVIARIMNNMMITDQIQPLAKGKGLKVAINVTNYCNFGKTFTLYSAIPHNVPAEAIEPAPEKVEDGLIQWKVQRIPTTESRVFSFVLPGLDPADFDETDLYVKGIDEELVIGAEPWKGKEELPRIEVETVKTISAEGVVTEGIVDRDEPEVTNADQEEDLEAEKEISKAKGRKGKEVELSLKDARPKATPKKKGNPFPEPKAAKAQRTLAAAEPKASAGKREAKTEKAAKVNPARAAAPTKKGGRK
ncbi:MAG TPA: DNA topoisomerase VI subunit B [Candidatus Thermoplasmatota archaeon]|nr:DNA topoisomerase VI subunit B [Candidatus Thermoplasmatota archaeon]